MTQIGLKLTELLMNLAANLTSNLAANLAANLEGRCESHCVSRCESAMCHARRDFNLALTHCHSVSLSHPLACKTMLRFPVCCLLPNLLYYSCQSSWPIMDVARVSTKSAL